MIQRTIAEISVTSCRKISFKNFSVKIAKSSNTLNDILEKIGENIRAGNIALTSLVSGIVLQNGEL